jgi:cell division protein FtsB
MSDPLVMQFTVSALREDNDNTVTRRDHRAHRLPQLVEGRSPLIASRARARMLR